MFSSSFPSSSFHSSTGGIEAPTSTTAAVKAGRPTKSPSSSLYPSIHPEHDLHEVAGLLDSRCGGGGTANSVCPLCGFQDFSQQQPERQHQDQHFYKHHHSIGVAGTTSPTCLDDEDDWMDRKPPALPKECFQLGTNSASSASSAAAAGVCWVCISALAQEKCDRPLDDKATHPAHHHALFSSSFSTAPMEEENFYDEDVFVTATAALPGENGMTQQEWIAMHHHSDPGMNTDDYYNYYYYYPHEEPPTQLPHEEYDSMIRHANNGDDANNKSDGENAIYIGEYNQHGQRHGAHGELIWSDGRRFVGSFVNGEQETGTLFFPDESSYTGEFRSGKMHGTGQRTFRNGDVYVGNFQFGQFWGAGKIKFANGDLYAGNFEANRFHDPKGRYFYSDGIALEGNFDRGTKQGKFKRQLPSGELDIIRFEKDQIVGEGARWNKNRTKTWLLRTVKSKKHHGHHRSMDENIIRGDAGTMSQQTQKSHRRYETFPKLKTSKNGGPKAQDDADIPTKTIVSGRIPVAQAVSIGYDCELGESMRETNPAFWTVGNIPMKSSKKCTSTSTSIRGFSEGDNSVV